MTKVPVIKTILCMQCGRCVMYCPQAAVERITNVACAKCIKYCMTMDVPCKHEHYVFIYEKCDACGMCIEACPNKAIYWLEIFDSFQKANQ